MGNNYKHLHSLDWNCINPHELRHLYRTHIDDPATGATSEEKKALPIGCGTPAKRLLKFIPTLIVNKSYEQALNYQNG
jgi:hypothetical protein